MALGASARWRLVLRVFKPQQPSGRRVALLIAAHPFPGNVRELKNVIERALIASGGGPIRREHLQLFGTATVTPARAVAQTAVMRWSKPAATLPKPQATA